MTHTEWNSEPVAFKPVLRRLVFGVFNSLQGSGLMPIPLRTWLLRRAGMKMGYDCCIFEGVYCGNPRMVTLGNGVFINAGCMLDDSAPITLARNVYLASHVRIITGSHKIGGATCRAGKHHQLPVEIGLGSWIGCAVTILPGVSIAHGCVIAAGSVVTKSTEPNGLYGGVPARRIRTLTEDGE